MLVQALRVETEMKNVHLQVTFLVQKGVGTRSHPTTPQDRNDTSSCSGSASQVFSSENDIGNFVGVPLTDADRRKVLLPVPPFRFIVSICNSWCSKSKFPEAMNKRIYMISVQ